MPHGLIAFAPLGPDGAAFGMPASLAASAMARIVVACLASSRPHIGTTTLCITLVTAALLVSVGLLPLGQGIILAMLLTALVSVLMLLLKLSGFAGLAALTPSPVTIGIANGTVILVLVGRVPLLLGREPGHSASPLQGQPASLLMAGLAIFLMLRPLHLVPAPLMALAAGVSVAPLVGMAPGPEQLSPSLLLAWREG